MNKNIRIKFLMETPIVLKYDRLPTVDALLYWALGAETESPERAAKEIPLEKTNGHWHGSQLFFLENDFGPYMDTTIITANMAPQRLDPLNNSIITGRWHQARGRSKADQDTYPSIAHRTLVAFARGDVDRIQQLLDNLPGIGKKTIAGSGKIEDIEIEEITSDYSLRLPNGQPARQVDYCWWQKQDGFQPGADRDDVRRLSPPYWQTAGRFRCYVPPATITKNVWAASMESSDWKPKAAPTSTKIDQDPYDFIWQHFGQYADKHQVPGETDGLGPRCNVCGCDEGLRRAPGTRVPKGGFADITLCYRCYSFGGPQPNIIRPGFINIGWAFCITPDRTQFVTTTDYSKQDELPFNKIKHVEFRYGVRPLELFKEILENPPNTPFIYGIATQAYTRLLRNLKVSYSPRYTWVCTAENTVAADLVALQNAQKTTTLNALQSVRKARFAYYRQLEPGKKKDTAAKKLQTVFDKNEGLEELVDTYFPTLEIGSWRWAAATMKK